MKIPTWVWAVIFIILLVLSFQFFLFLLPGILVIGVIGLIYMLYRDYKSSSNRVRVECKNPRPEICTEQYAPVCGARTGLADATYSNSCFACLDKNVSSYTAGKC